MKYAKWSKVAGGKGHKRSLGLLGIAYDEWYAVHVSFSVLVLSESNKILSIKDKDNYVRPSKHTERTLDKLPVHL